jgi:hypothetical protein
LRPLRSQVLSREEAQKAQKSNGKDDGSDRSPDSARLDGFECRQTEKLKASWGENG